MSDHPTASRPIVPVYARWLFIALFVVATMMLYRNRDTMRALLGPVFAAIDGLGPWAYPVFTLVYTVASVLLVPTTLLAPGLGFTLGVWGGTVVSVLGSTLSTAANYFIARYLGRSWFGRKVSVNHRYRAVEIACRTRGFQIVLMTRLTPVFPSNIMSYFYGVTSVTLGPLLSATALGMLPRILVCTTIGAAAKSFTAAAEGNLRDQPFSNYLLYGSVVVTMIAFVWLARIANRCLKEALDEVEALSPPHPRAAPDSSPATAAALIPPEAQPHESPGHRRVG
jgi:uncharacterized membrane protein YdjX (TVP38/TMEM64 family)